MRLGNSGQGEYLHIIVLAVIVILALGLYFLGQTEKTQPTLEEVNEKVCDKEIELFYQEYGQGAKSSAIFLNGNNFYIVDLADNWTVPINSSDCRIVEDREPALLGFQSFDYNERIKEIPNNFYEQIQDCPQISVAKGGEKACNFVTPINQAIDVPITEVIATIPTKDIEKLSSAFVSQEYKREVKVIAGKTASLIKIAKGSGTVLAGLEIVEGTGCFFSNSAERVIFDFADNGNQVFTNAKNSRYKSETISVLDGTNEYIKDMINIKEEFNLIQSNPDDLLGTIGGTIISRIADAWGNVTEGCSDKELIQKIDDYANKIQTNRETAELQTNGFLERLTELKDKATLAMAREEEFKNLNRPDLFTTLVFPVKAFYYEYFLHSNAGMYESQQLYVSAEKESEASFIIYADFWRNISLIDWFFFVAWIGLILAIIGFIGFKFYSSRKS